MRTSWTQPEFLQVERELTCSDAMGVAAARCLQEMSACDRAVQHLGHLLATGQVATRAALALLHRVLKELEQRAD
jgi:hypothetical protein